MEGFRIVGKVVNNLIYADDTVILAESEQQLQQLINTVVTESELKGYLNSTKSFTMVFSKAKVNPACSVSVHGNVLGQVHSSVYLGSPFTSDTRSDKETRRRIGIAKATFTSMNIILTARNISIAVRLRVLKCWSTLLYGCETWTISGDMIKKLEAPETWFYRRMLRISWKEKGYKCRGVSSYEYKHILADRHCSLTTYFPWAYSTKGELENPVVTRFVDGKRDRGRKRETFLTYLSKIVGKSPLELINLVLKRDVWTKFCAHNNLRLRIRYTMMMKRPLGNMVCV